jgi:hypothetical protein
MTFDRFLPLKGDGDLKRTNEFEVARHAARCHRDPL